MIAAFIQPIYANLGNINCGDNEIKNNLKGGDKMFWAITILSIAGVILNIYQNRWGFIFWMITNAAWAVIDFYKGIPQQTVLFGFIF